MNFPQHSLASLGTIQTGSTPRTADQAYWGGDTPFVTPTELDQDTPVFSAPRTLSERGVQQSRLLEEGAVMICCIGSLGKIGIAGRAVVTNQQINSIEFDQSKVFPKYGFYACRRLKPTLISMAPATTIPIVSKSKFAQLEIPLPTLPEQRRIAAILDQAHALRAKRREALAQLDSLTQSIFIDMFGDPIRNPHGWRVLALRECADRIQIGPFGSQLHQEDYVEGGVPLVNPTHIQGGKIVPDLALTIAPQKFRELGQYHLAEHDLVLGRRGEMGRCAVVTLKEHGWFCGTGSLFIRPNRSLISTEYLSFAISSGAMRRHLEGVAQGVTMANLNKDLVGALPIPMPPLALQQTFATRIQAVESLKATHRAALSESDALFASLQHRAFAGHLS